ncbi:MAG: acyltransferase, partial [Bacteroidales bacterium]|nr:acyltransferase [Candidatus Cryptobacteroides faecihippi]
MLNNSKQHYAILDGLRGVAALMVVGYHLFEAIAFAAGAPEQKMFHGFLAVDFFLMLSGFVMGYAYDDRWDTMSVGGFFRRRLIRLHPLVVMGGVIGAIAFIGQGCLKWDGT